MSALSGILDSVQGLAVFSFGVGAQTPVPTVKALLVVAHPDDESECAAFVYRITREFGGIADQIVVTNGEGGRNYAAPAASYYGLPLHKKEGRGHLIRVRQKEQLRAGRALGIRHTWFLGQTDTGVTPGIRDAMDAWDVTRIKRRIARQLQRENYDVVIVLLPSSGTHGHHKAVALLTLDAVNQLPEASRPAVLGNSTTDPGDFFELAGYPSTRAEFTWSLDRRTPLPCHPALNYSIIVNWAVSEHKSQGFFQMENSRRRFEYFWLFEAGGKVARSRWLRFRNRMANAVQEIIADEERTPQSPAPAVQTL